MTKVMRKIIQIDEELCTGCGQCIVDCAESALEIVDGVAKLVADKYCDGLGACLGGCPTGALKIIERQADDFDEEAVEALIKANKEKGSQADKPSGCGCPSAQLKSFPASALQTIKTQGVSFSGAGSALSHWPIQIRLVPPTAPFLKDADLLIAADCTAAAYPAFHSNLLPRKVLMLGCPKFDDTEAYVQKFVDILNTTTLKSITLAIMEVPCCQNMRNILAEAYRRSGKNVPTEVVVISAQGQILNKGPMEV